MNMGLDPQVLGLDAGLLATLAWAWARCWAMLRVQPLWSGVAGASWNLIAAAFSLVLCLALAPGGALAPMAGIQWPGLSNFVLGIGFELLLGSVVGLWVALPQHAAIGAGWVSAEGLGLPATSTAFARLWACMTLVFGFALMAHHAALESLAATFARWPPFSPAALWDPGARELAFAADIWGDLGLALHSATLLALALATPILLTRAVLSSVTISAVRGLKTSSEFDRAWRPWILVSACMAALGASWATFSSAWATAVG